MWIIKIIKIKGFYSLGILNEHWGIYSCLQIPPRENWFQFVRREYASAINFPCIITLHGIHEGIIADKVIDWNLYEEKWIAK